MFFGTYPLAPEYKKEKILEEVSDIVKKRSDLINQITNLNLLKLLSFKIKFEKYLNENKKYTWLNNHNSLKYAASFFHFIPTNLKYANLVIDQMNQAQIKLINEKKKNTPPSIESAVNIKIKAEAEIVFSALESIRNIYIEMKSNHIRGFVKENIKAILYAFDCYKDENMEKMNDTLKYISKIDVTKRLPSPI